MAALAVVAGVMLLGPLQATGSPGSKLADPAGTAIASSAAAGIVDFLTGPAGTPAAPPKVAIIVGPVGEELTPVYIEIAEAAATQATELGATVARAYSPEATPENLLTAVDGANIVVYLGHGVGFPNPYSDTLRPDKVNGFGLQGPNARGDHSDSWQDGTLAYYGEEWLVANANPAPGWVMIHSNVCYAPGAGEGFDEPATAEIAAARVSSYSRPVLEEMGASAYFATDFHLGAAALIGSILGSPDKTYGEVFASEPRFEPDALSREAHAVVAGAEVWLHRSVYLEGKTDYWYAFAGNAAASPALTWGTGDVAPATVEAPAAVPPMENGVVHGIASHYPGDAGWEGQATATLPDQYGGGPGPGMPAATVVVCADRCANVLVLDSCDCYVGTSDVRVINLSQQAWQLVSDRSLSDGLLQVSLHQIGYDPPVRRTLPNR